MLSNRGQWVAVLRKFERSQHLLLMIPIRRHRYHYSLLPLFKEEEDLIGNKIMGVWVPTASGYQIKVKN